MPTIIVTTLSPGELFRDAHTRAKTASAAIERLKHAPLAPGETIHERALAVVVHAHALAEAFEIIDALADAIMCEPEHVSPPSSTVSPAPGHRGVRQEPEDPNTN